MSEPNPPLNKHLEAYLEAVKAKIKRYHDLVREEARLDDRDFGEQSSSDHSLPQQQELS